jgi:hypothetical protein
MGKRFTFQCWNCPNAYQLYRELDDTLKFLVACPFCGAEGVVDLAPFSTTVVNLHKGTTEQIPQQEEIKLVLPDILPVKKVD